MTFIDPNITFSPQVCNLAIGAMMGVGGLGVWILSFISKIGLIIIGVYLIYKIGEIIINKIKHRR
jgi:hypothetical protein